jgi:hypothetical protein
VLVLLLSVLGLVLPLLVVMLLLPLSCWGPHELG